MSVREENIFRAVAAAVVIGAVVIAAVLALA